MLSLLGFGKFEELWANFICDGVEGAAVSIELITRVLLFYMSAQVKVINIQRVLIVLTLRLHWWAIQPKTMSRFLMSKSK